MKIIVTSGPTRSYIDEIRYISNYSSGELGTLITEKLVRNGHKVTVLYGKGSKKTDLEGVKNIEVETVSDLLKALRKEIRKGADAVIHAMAVLDYEFPRKIEKKIKSEKKTWVLRLIRTPKIIREIKKISPGIKLVGFKLEYNKNYKALITEASKLIKESNADYVVANDYKEIKAGKHKAVIVAKSGWVKRNLIGKEKISKEIAALFER